MRLQTRQHSQPHFCTIPVICKALTLCPSTTTGFNQTPSGWKRAYDGCTSSISLLSRLIRKGLKLKNCPITTLHNYKRRIQQHPYLEMLNLILLAPKIMPVLSVCQITFRHILNPLNQEVNRKKWSCSWMHLCISWQSCQGTHVLWGQGYYHCAPWL